MGIVSAQALATTVITDSTFLWDVPNHWSLADAATVPVAYLTAYYALIIRGNLQKGDKVSFFNSQELFEKISRF